MFANAIESLEKEGKSYRIFSNDHRSCRDDEINRERIIGDQYCNEHTQFVFINARNANEQMSRLSVHLYFRRIEVSEPDTIWWDERTNTSTLEDYLTKSPACIWFKLNFAYVNVYQILIKSSSKFGHFEIFLWAAGLQKIARKLIVDIKLDIENVSNTSLANENQLKWSFHFEFKLSRKVTCTSRGSDQKSTKTIYVNKTIDKK